MTTGRISSVIVKAPARTTWYLDRGLSSSQFSTRFGERSATHRAVAFDSLLETARRLTPYVVLDLGFNLEQEDHAFGSSDLDELRELHD